MNRMLAAAKEVLQNFRGEIAVLTFAAVALIAACGGGSGTGNPLPSVGPSQTPGPTPCPSGWTGTPPNCVQSASATGKVVDYDSQAPLAGVPVALATWAPSASPSPVATTAADGTFTFTVQPGTYALQIGSNSATDMRMTLVQRVVLVPGTNALTVASPPPQPYVTPDPVQLSGDFRLKTMNNVEATALGYANTDIPGSYANDEYLWETGHWDMEQSANAPLQLSYPPSWLIGGGPGLDFMEEALSNSPAMGLAGGASGENTSSCPPQGVQVIVNDLKLSYSNPWRIGIECDPTRQGETILGISGIY